MKAKRLTNMEKRILARLDKNARTPLRRVGRAIRKSEQSVSYTVNSLLKRGVIKGFYSLVDYSRLSVLNFRVFFKVSYGSQRGFKKMIKFLVDEPHTLWVATCGGRHDIICTFGAHNPSQFNKLLRSIMEQFPRQLQSYTILTTIVIRMLDREYLPAPHRSRREIILGGDREPYELSERDTRILAEISDNARKSAVEIGKALSCNSRTVVSRIRELENLKVIMGYKPFLNFSLIKRAANLLMVRYHNISVEDEQKLINYLTFHSNVTCLTKTLGEWDLEIRIEADDMWSLKSIESEIRHKFAKMISMTETLPVYKEYKNTFFPRFVLESTPFP